MAGLALSSLSTSDQDHRLHRDHDRKALDMTFEKYFAERFSEFLQENFANPTQVAAAFGVRERTAENWWIGLNAPSGAKVARAFQMHAESARRHLFSGRTSA